MTIGDIEGCKAKPLYKGAARQIMLVKDIEGTRPLYERVSLETPYTKIVDETEELQFIGLQ
jgi:hypothetical protein